MAAGGFEIIDGLTNTTFTTPDSAPDFFPEIEDDESTTAGGLLRAERAGRRLVGFERKLRYTSSQVATLQSLLSNGSLFYYYRPLRELPPGTVDDDFPMACRMKLTKQGQAYDGSGIVHYCELSVRAVDIEV